MALKPSNSSNLEQLVVKWLMYIAPSVAYLNHESERSGSAEPS